MHTEDPLSARHQRAEHATLKGTVVSSVSATTQPPATSNPAARAEGLSKIYGTGDTQVVALDDVTVGFPTGRFTAIMGPSGSGKSTLMHV